MKISDLIASVWASLRGLRTQRQETIRRRLCGRIDKANRAGRSNIWTMADDKQWDM